eukprot:SAG11_NODE_13644_length_645_cov_1.417582_2_plen_111_part_01
MRCHRSCFDALRNLSHLDMRACPLLSRCAIVEISLQPAHASAPKATALNDKQLVQKLHEHFASRVAGLCDCPKYYQQKAEEAAAAQAQADKVGPSSIQSGHARITCSPTVN